MERWFKITREDGTSLFDASPPPYGVIYEVDKIVELPPEKFKDDPFCGYGLHYGDLDSAVLDGLGLIMENRRLSWASMARDFNFRVFIVQPLGKKIRITSNKYKTDKLMVEQELRPEEYIPLLLLSESSIVREVGAMRLSKQDERIKRQCFRCLKPGDEATEWLSRWDYTKSLNSFVGKKVTTTEEYSRYCGLKRIVGEISDIDSNTLVANIEGKFLNLYWLEPLVN